MTAPDGTCLSSKHSPVQPSTGQASPVLDIGRFEISLYITQPFHTMSSTVGEQHTKLTGPLTPSTEVLMAF